MPKQGKTKPKRRMKNKMGNYDETWVVFEGTDREVNALTTERSYRSPYPKYAIHLPRKYKRLASFQ